MKPITQAEDLAEFKRKYDERNANLKAQGITLLTYKVPCCGGELDSPANYGEKSEMLTTCPLCGSLYMKISTRTKITALVETPGVPRFKQ